MTPPTPLRRNFGFPTKLPKGGVQVAASPWVPTVVWALSVVLKHTAWGGNNRPPQGVLVTPYYRRETEMEGEGGLGVM